MRQTSFVFISVSVLIHKVGRRQAIFCTEAVAEIVWRAKASQIGCLSDIMLAIEQKFAGKSQTAVADAIGVSKQCVSDYKSGKSVPSIETLFLLCKVLDVSSDFLLGLSDGI